MTEQAISSKAEQAITSKAIWSMATLMAEQALSRGRQEGPVGRHRGSQACRRAEGCSKMASSSMVRAWAQHCYASPRRQRPTAAAARQSGEDASAARGLTRRDEPCAELLGAMADRRRRWPRTIRGDYDLSAR